MPICIHTNADVFVLTCICITVLKCALRGERFYCVTSLLVLFQFFLLIYLLAFLRSIIQWVVNQFLLVGCSLMDGFYMTSILVDK